MRQTNVRLLAEQKPLSVIDVLTAGFEIVRKRPWTMLVPIVMDVGIWLLPRISLADLFRPALLQYLVTNAASPDAPATAEEARQMASQLANSINLFGLVSFALSLVVRVPALLSFDSGDFHSPINTLAYTLPLQSAPLALFLFVPLFLLALLPGAFFLEWTAQGVRPLDSGPRFAWMRRVAMLWLKLIAFSAVLVFIVAATFMATGLIVLIGQLFLPGNDVLDPFLGALVFVGLIWISIYFFFTVSAMSVSNVGLLEALRRSVLIFRFHFWASLGLFALGLFLYQGLALVWHGLAVSPLGLLVGIVANAFIGTSLLAASMVFYQDRMSITEKRLASARMARR